MGHPQVQPGRRYEAPLRAHRVPQVRGLDGQRKHLQVLRRQGQDTVGCGTATSVPPGARERQGAGGSGGPGRGQQGWWRAAPCQPTGGGAEDPTEGPTGQGCHQRKVRQSRSLSQLRSRGSRQPQKLLETPQRPPHSLLDLRRSGS